VRFLSSGFVQQSTPFGPLFALLHFFKFCIKFAELFEFEIRTAQWATAGNQIFLAMLYCGFDSRSHTQILYKENRKMLFGAKKKQRKKFFLANTRDLKLGWCRPSVLLFIYIHFFGITVPLKDEASF
jgi:hypothetical protein